MALCLALTAVLVACQYALIRLRGTFDEHIVARIRASKFLQKRLDEADRLLRALHFGVLLLASLYGAGALALAHVSSQQWNLLAFSPAWFACVAAIFIVFFGLFYVVGYLTPRGIGLTHPVGVLLRMGWTALLFYGIFHPPLKWAAAVNRPLSRLFKVNPAQAARLLDMERQACVWGGEIRNLSQTVRSILDNALNLGSLDVSDIMVPRNQVVYLDTQEPLLEMLECAKKSGHTRFPLCRGDLDHCIGLIHIKDIFRLNQNAPTLDSLRRDILLLPANERLDGALAKLLRNKQHMAVVVDDFGGTAGIVTLDGVIAQIVGEIRDEFDTAQEIFITPLPDGKSFRVSGLTPLHDLEERLGRPFASDTVSTLGGLVTDTLERMPQKGDTVTLDGANVDVRVDEVNDRRVLWTTLFLRQDPAQDENLSSEI